MKCEKCNNEVQINNFIIECKKCGYKKCIDFTPIRKIDLQECSNCIYNNCCLYLLDKITF